MFFVTMTALCNRIGSWLGSGQFGTVHQGTWKCTPKHTVEVAVKTLKDDANTTDRVKFLQEAAIMAQFRHPNVVTLHGVAKKNGKVHQNNSLMHSRLYSP